MLTRCLAVAFAVMVVAACGTTETIQVTRIVEVEVTATPTVHVCIDKSINRAELNAFRQPHRFIQFSQGDWRWQRVIGEIHEKCNDDSSWGEWRVGQIMTMHVLVGAIPTPPRIGTSSSSRPSPNKYDCSNYRSREQMLVRGTQEYRSSRASDGYRDESVADRWDAAIERCWGK